MLAHGAGVCGGAIRLASGTWEPCNKPSAAQLDETITAKMKPCCGDVSTRGRTQGACGGPFSPCQPPVSPAGRAWVWGCWQSRNEVAVTAPVHAAEDRRGWLVISSAGWCQMPLLLVPGATPPPDPRTPVRTLEVVPSACCVQKTFQFTFFL